MNCINRSQAKLFIYGRGQGNGGALEVRLVRITSPFIHAPYYSIFMKKKVAVYGYKAE